MSAARTPVAVSVVSVADLAGDLLPSRHSARLYEAADTIDELYDALRDALEILYASGSSFPDAWIDALRKARGEQVQS